VTPSILSAGRAMDSSYELLAIDITREVNRIPHAQIVLLDGEASQQKFAISDQDFFEPGKPVEIKLRYEGAPDQGATVFTGVVVAQIVEAGLQGSLLTIELKDTAVKLTSVRKSAVYRDQADDAVIGQIITGAGLKKGSIAATQPQHRELVQYYCTDWDFILARAESLGLLVVVEDGQISLPPIALGGAANHLFEYGLSEIFSFEIEAAAGQQYPEIQSIAWDIKNQKLTKAAKAKEFALAQGNLDGAKIARTIGTEAYLLNSPVPLNPKELQSWSDAAMARSRMTMLRGRIAVPGFGDIKLMDVLEVAGVGKRFNGQTLVTGIRHRVDQHGWQTDIQFGLAAERFAARRDIVDAPAAGLLPAVNGLQIGVVGQFAEDPDKELRVPVILPGIDEKKGAVWARLATPDAGKGRGYFFRPEPGDEVVVGFFNDDPRQAVILGAMYSSKNAPHTHVAKLEKDNLAKAIITKKGISIRFLDNPKAAIFIETPNKSQIALDDDAQTIQITDQHGNAIKMSQDGIEIKTKKDLKIDAGGNVEIKGKKVDVK
jgi:Rhs element Vgr protein